MNANNVWSSLDDIPLRQTAPDPHEKVPNVAEIVKALHTNDEEGILAKMAGAPNAPDPSKPIPVPAKPDFEAEQVDITQPKRKMYAWQRNALAKAKANRK